MSPAPRWFRLLLGVLPEPFRSRHEDEIVELMAVYGRDRSAIARIGMWVRAGMDVLRTGAALRVSRGPSALAASDPGRHADAPGFFESFLRDVRYAARSLRKDLGYTAFSVLVVGFGVGASVTVFSVAQALLLRPLPFDEPERLVWISNGEFGRGQALSSISVQVGYLNEIRAGAEQMADAGGFHLFDRDGDHTLRTDDRASRVTRLRVTGNFLDVLGVEPALGRGFTDEEAWDGGPRSIILTHEAWLRFFGASPDVVGRPVDLDDTPATVVGVLPEAFSFETVFAPGRRIDYLQPYPMSERSHQSGNTLGLIGRLADGASLETARQEIGRFAGESGARGERWNSFDPVVTPLRDHLAGGFRTTMALLTVAVSLVMLLVCANLSNLLLARGAGREREFALRSAIGASRGRLVQQIMTESLLVSVAGAGLGVLLAVRGTALLSGLDLRIPMLATASVDGWALGLSVFAALGVGLVFGLVPAVRSSSPAVGAALKEGGRGATSGRRLTSLRNGLVVAQVAIASVLLVGSTLTARSLMTLLDTDLGYQVDRTVAVRVDPSVRFASDEERLTYYSEILDGVTALPVIEAAGMSDMLPMAFNRRWDARDPQGDPERAVFPYVRVVSDGYLDAMALTLLSGRDFTRADGPDEAPVALVNEVLAEQLWGEADPIGRTVSSSGGDYRVVGVVRPTRQLSVDQEPGPELFFTMRQVPDQSAVHLILRGRQDADDLVASARGVIGSIDASIPLDEVVRIRDVVDASVAPRRFTVLLLTGFAVFALVLAALGIYAVISYSVSQRRMEIGIRVALGATAGRVQTALVREILTLTAMGLLVGLLLARSTSRLLEGLLFGVSAMDPLSYLLVAGLLGGSALLAAYTPARRAARAHPLDALGHADGGH